MINHRLRVIVKDLRKIEGTEQIANELEDLIIEISDVQSTLCDAVVKLDITI